MIPLQDQFTAVEGGFYPMGGHGIRKRIVVGVQRACNYLRGVYLTAGEGLQSV